MTLSSYKFTWNQPCSGTVYVYLCDTNNKSACASGWYCMVTNSKKWAQYSGGSGTGYKGDFYCGKALVSGKTYYWVIDSQWGLTAFQSFVAQ